MQCRYKKWDKDLELLFSFAPVLNILCLCLGGNQKLSSKQHVLEAPGFFYELEYVKLSPRYTTGMYLSLQTSSIQIQTPAELQKIKNYIIFPATTTSLPIFSASALYLLSCTSWQLLFCPISVISFAPFTGNQPPNLNRTKKNPGKYFRKPAFQPNL